MVKPKVVSYTEDDLLRAVAEVQVGSLSYRKASVKNNIPTMTLHDKIEGKAPMVVGARRPPTFLSEEQKYRLVKHLLRRANFGYGVPCKDVPAIVKDILDEGVSNGYVIPEERRFPDTTLFADNKPSLQWVYGFLKRHPEASIRTPEYIGYQRAYVTEEVCRKWFNSLETYLKDEYNLNAKTFLTEVNADRIFYLDESGFPLQGTNGRMKIIAEKGARSVRKLTTDSKEQITVLACTSANGKFSKPLVIFPGSKNAITILMG